MRPTIDIRTSDGWTAARVVGPRVLAGANGIRFGPDGLLYVAQAYGSEIVTVDVERLELTTFSAVGGPAVSPDDLDFDSHGRAFVTEFQNARVTCFEPGGRSRVVADDVPGANGVTVFDDRVFIDECRPDGRLVEVFVDGRPARALAHGLQFPNALDVGPDGNIYFPAVHDGEIWRMPLDGSSPPELFARGFAAPSSVTFDSAGRLTVSQALTGDVTTIDLATRATSTRATTWAGIDNVAFGPDDRLFVSNFMDGRVSELTAEGERPICPAGLLGPWGLSWCGSTLLVADGNSVAAVSAAGDVSRVATFNTPGFPGFVRSIVALGPDTWILSTAAGSIVRFDVRDGARTLAHVEQAMGMARTGDGGLLIATGAQGSVLLVDASGATTTVADGLADPVGVAVDASGGCYVSERAAGRVVEIGERRVVAAGLAAPEGVACTPEGLLVVDAERREVVEVPASGTATPIATNMPVGAAPPGIVRDELPGLPGLIGGPLRPFADAAAGPDGAWYVSGDADGSIVRLARRSR